MADNSIAYRDVSSNFIKKWKEDGWKKFYKDHKNELFLGIRTNCVKLYYKRGWIVKFEYLKRNKRLRATLNKTYCQHFENLEITCTDLTDELLGEIKQGVNNRYQGKYKEYQVQQNLFIKNNANVNPEWYCIDMEYAESKRGKSNGKSVFRFDIIAVNTNVKNGEPNTALIELKHGAKSIKDNLEQGNNSGVYKHLVDFYNFKNSKESRNILETNINHLIKSYKGLVDGFSNFEDERKFKMTPKFCIITMDSDLYNEKNLKDQIYNCISNGIELSDDPFKIYGKGVYIDNEKDRFECEFLFSNNEGLNIENLTINSILNSSQYDAVGLI